MSHCVYYAITDHLHWLDLKPGWDDWESYQDIRLMAENYGYTFGGLVPGIVKEIALRRDLNFLVEYSDWFPYKFWLDQSNKRERGMIRKQDWHINHISAGAGIYLPVHNMHAVFIEERPEYECSMSIKIRHR